jgi:NDP-sugar pyrophosphorylase family protein
MLPINGVPHLEYQIRLLREHGITDIIFSTGYLHKQIEDYFGDGSKFGVRIQYKEDGEVQLGTAGAIRNCADLIEDEDILVLNGDILTNINLTDMKQQFQSNLQLPMMIALTPVEDPTQFGVAIVSAHKQRKVTKFVEKPVDNSYGNLINAGIYMMHTGIVNNFIEDGFSMIEQTLFPQFAKANMLGAYTSDFVWIDIGTHERYAQAQEIAEKYF